jgi:hypothetical protein
MLGLVHGLETATTTVALAQAVAPDVGRAVTPDASPRSVTPFASLEEGVGVRSDDGDFSLAAHLLFQTRYEHVERDGGRDDGFRVVLARPALRGVAFIPWVQYFVQLELAGSPLLLDAEIVAQPIPELGLKVGQFVTPFSREFLIVPGALLFPDFAPSNVQFRSNRDTGAMFLGSALDRRIEYFAAVMNGNGINRGGNDNAELAWIARVAGNVIGESPYTEIPQLLTGQLGLSVGLNASYAEVEQIGTTLDPVTGTTTTARLGSAPTSKVGADVAFHTGPLSVQGEFYTRTVGTGGGARHSVARGGFAQVGVFVVPRTVEVGIRGDLVDLDVGGARPPGSRFDLGAAYYFRENHLKLQLAYAWSDTRVVPLAPGASTSILANTVTLQAQLWF